MQRSLEQWVDYIQTLHPRSIDLSLDRVGRVWERFRPPELAPVIAVAGTNGKGSSVSMLESIYRHAGYRTGAFTSPHLVRFNERICLNNEPVSDQRLVRAFEKIERIREDTSLTFFEFNTLIALDIFCDAELDVILLEVGMGGRLDAVNIVDNEVALITAIGLDHCAWLGTDREQIGAEKAGIIKPGGRAVIADPQAPECLAEIAAQQRAILLQSKRDYAIENNAAGCALFKSDTPGLALFSGLVLPKAPAHQYHNMAGVIAVVAQMNAILTVTPAQVRFGLERQSLGGRLQMIKGEPKILLDVSHNDASVMAMLEYIDSLTISGRIHAVFGALADKRYEQAYDLLKMKISAWYLSSIEGERGQSAAALQGQLFKDQTLQGSNISVQCFNSPQRAFRQAINKAEKHDLIVIFGSFHIVGAIIADLNR